MKLKFWGVRGSINSPLSPEKYREKIEKVLSFSYGKDISDKKKINELIDSLPAHLSTTFGGNTSCV
ncbi:MAG: MBL fold metallo-hydrolase, partial [Candidatus Delongbacteria bacterium]|nr:MBL fold metallo-hydrolase [Candidatus Delongbacteria bacterium]